jgi:hypothetical protein
VTPAVTDPKRVVSTIVCGPLGGIFPCPSQAGPGMYRAKHFTMYDSSKGFQRSSLQGRFRLGRAWSSPPPISSPSTRSPTEISSKPIADNRRFRTRLCRILTSALAFCAWRQMSVGEGSESRKLMSTRWPASHSPCTSSQVESVHGTGWEA